MKKKSNVKAPAVKAANTVETKAEEVKATAPATPVAPVKEEPKKVEVKKEEPVKAAAKEVVKEAAPAKETAPKAAAKKADAKPAKKTTTAAKEKAVPEVFVQYSDNGEQEASVAELVEKVKALYVAEGHRESSIKSLQIYIKPQMWRAYYVINGKITGEIELF